MPTIVDIIQNDDNFKTLSALLKDADLFGTLGDGSYAFFAPPDDAFSKLPEGTVDELLKDRATLSTLLRYHAVEGEVTAADALGTTLTTLSGGEISVSGDAEHLSVGRASVLKADIMADNGAVHVVDQVLLPL